MTEVQQRSRTRTAIAAALAISAGAGISYGLWSLRRRRRAAARLAGGTQSGATRSIRVRVLYGTVTGTSEKWARQVADDILREAGEPGSTLYADVSVEDLTDFQFDNLLAAATQRVDADVVIVLMSTQAEGAPPPRCAHFCTLLEDHVHDFRVGRAALAHLRFAVVGFGSTEYQAAHFCTAATRVDRGFAGMSARRLLPLKRVTDTEDAQPQLEPWGRQLLELLRGDKEEPVVATKAEGEQDAASDATSTASTSDGEGDKAEPAASDVEDAAEGCAGGGEPREMLTKKHRAQLTKEGYKLIGSHSAVKLCRWTKHQLRGRGGCYKHSFYGITSYQCMEATPSLACANKCVFCWRHHKNPVGTEWKWRQDEPDMIVAEGIEQHRRMIRECRGIPGVRKDRFEEAMTVRHCALSLVGEPIMYPRINDLVADLHRRKISTFLVTNAQFPEAIRALQPVTQLYVSVDAATPDDLKAVDRPLFRDFWERFQDSLRELGRKRQRTTYRLTLVKDQNMSSPADYAKLLVLGNPDFVEIKSMTFCGESKASSLRMESVPWHEEVRTFAEAMLKDLPEYELACEHQHSCIVLLAHRRFKSPEGWRTWIDYDRFHELVASGKEFEALDYAAATPDWALYGSEEAGFDPKETRVFHQRTKRRAKEGLLSEEQLRMYPSNPATA